MSELCPASAAATVDRIAAFALVLRVAGLMPPDELEYFERPWKWQPEYEAWLAAGCPSPEHAGVPVGQRTLDSMRWERFVANAEAAVRS